MFLLRSNCRERDAALSPDPGCAHRVVWGSKNILRAYNDSDRCYSGGDWASLTRSRMASSVSDREQSSGKRGFRAYSPLAFLSFGDLQACLLMQNADDSDCAYVQHLSVQGIQSGSQEHPRSVALLPKFKLVSGWNCARNPFCSVQSKPQALPYPSFRRGA